MPQIKICGISSADTLGQIAELSPQFVGFVHHPASVRHVSLPLLAELVRETPEHIKSVVVTVNPDDQFLDALFAACSPDFIQLHGDEAPTRAQQIKQRYGVGVIKAIAVADQSDIIAAKLYAGAADMLLFDTKASAGVSGGTGQSFDWNLLANYSADIPWFLSGGLSVENIAEAIRITHAPALDASSHLETPPKSGHKDIEKARTFVDKVRN